MALVRIPYQMYFVRVLDVPSGFDKDSIPNGFDRYNRSKVEPNASVLRGWGPKELPKYQLRLRSDGQGWTSSLVRKTNRGCGRRMGGAADEWGVVRQTNGLRTIMSGLLGGGLAIQPYIYIYILKTPYGVPPPHPLELALVDALELAAVDVFHARIEEACLHHHPQNNFAILF